MSNLWSTQPTTSLWLFSVEAISHAGPLDDSYIFHRAQYNASFIEYLLADHHSLNVGSEDKGKAERELRAKQKQSGTPATEGTAPTEEKSKEKAHGERERKQKPSGIGPQGGVESPKVGETDIKWKQHEPDTSGMMERGKTQMERGRSEQEKPEQKGAQGQGGVPVGPGQEHEKIR
jgi:hypothetical protein